MTTDSNAVFEIGLMMRATWNLHSLNNEGTVGNVSEPRTVVLADGTKTDGVSGEMLKHLHTYNVWLAESRKDRFCPACQRLQPQKADFPQYRATLGGTPSAVMSQAIANCILCDLHGFLVTGIRRQRRRRGAPEEAEGEQAEEAEEAAARAVPRKSTVEFGWAVGIPEVYRDIHLHSRNWPEPPEGEEERAAQMPYHRPTRSGVYAVVSLFQPWRIGLNEINYEYAIDNEPRLVRYRLGLEAYKNMLQRGDGAMTSTRLPHIEVVEGVIAVSRRNAPAPVFSPLRDDYGQQLEALAASNGRLTLHRFSTVGEACGILDELAKSTLHRFRS
jgi:CRISPR-associated protein Cst2